MVTRTIGLGCMRLSTKPDRDDVVALEVIHAALDAGATILDTADAYCRVEADVGHNERLVAKALAGWSGDRSRIIVATKGGMRRPNGAWIPDGRAKHLRAACEASRERLGVAVIDHYQLHVVDPKTSLQTSVRALAALRDAGLVRDVGLCNVTVSQIREAMAIVPIAAIQVSVSPFDDESLRNGVAEFCRDNGIRVLAHRPLGGDKVQRLARDEALSRIAETHGAAPADVALAWLMSFGPDVVPLPGATRVETARAIGQAIRVTLDEEERSTLDAKFSGRLLRVPRSRRRPGSPRGDVVVVMGMPGAGKSVLAHELAIEGHARLNRDATGGSLTALSKVMTQRIDAGHDRIVLDNTYPTRKSRNEVIEAAWERGLGARCIWLRTGIGDAQINAIRRMIAVHGALPNPEDIRTLGRNDTRYLLPDAQFRYERTLEPPTDDEGFERVEERAFMRAATATGRPGLILDLDDVAADARVPEHVVETMRQHHADGWALFVFAWRPQVARGEKAPADVDAEFAALRDNIGVPVATGACVHDAGPPACWCRKPIPGRIIEFADRSGISLARSIVTGSAAADRTMAERIGARFEPLDYLRRV